MKKIKYEDIPNSIVEAISNGIGRYKLIKQFNLPEWKARTYISLYRKKYGSPKNQVSTKKEINIDEKPNSTYVSVRSLDVKTPEEALKIAKIDMSVWEIERQLVNSWEVTMGLTKSGTGKPETYTNWQVKVWLKRKVVNSQETAIKNLIKEIPKFRFDRVPRFVPSANKDIAAELDLFDAHISKLAWHEETGRGDYDLPISCDDFHNAGEKNLSQIAIFNPSKIYFIIGQDYLHVENYQGTTPMAGHVLDNDSRLPKIIEAGKSSLFKMVYKCRDIAPTECLWIPGNHDQYSSLWLAMLIDEHFRDDKYVTVDYGPQKRKARLHGNLLVGWCHAITGKQASWANELAQAFPKEWGKSKFREWHHGHLHKKNEVKTMPIFTCGGVLMRQITALSPIDAWHYDNLFTDAVPGGESFVWSKNDGVIANFTIWTHPHTSGRC